ncbi:MAG: helix-turn-helix domain-containing protein [Lachnospiraceae bacterium]|jgi:AraC-like DNA-binding protein
MIFDIRNERYTFKHAIDLYPKVNSDHELEHFHTSYEFLYFIHGSAKLAIQHHTFKVKPTNLLIIKPGEFHYMVVNPDVTYERIVIRFYDTELPDYYKSALKNLGTVYDLQNSLLLSTFSQIDRLYDPSSSENSMFILKNLLNIIIALICNRSLQMITATQMDEDVRSIVSFIDEHLTSINCIEDISKELHMSSASIQQKIRCQLHTSAMAYVRTQKCMLAQSLMQQGVSPTSVYLRCGFSDYSTFYRTYRKIFKLSPSEYMNQKKL